MVLRDFECDSYIHNYVNLDLQGIVYAAWPEEFGTKTLTDLGNNLPCDFLLKVLLSRERF